jgi:hypothetical protein
MRRNEIFHILSERRAELERFGVKSLALFGSVARDEARENSDIDMLVDFSHIPGFFQFMDLKFFLEDLLGCKVDLVMPKTLKPRIRPRIEREAVHVPGF